LELLASQAKGLQALQLFLCWSLGRGKHEL